MYGPSLKAWKSSSILRRAESPTGYQRAADGNNNDDNNNNTTGANNNYDNGENNNYNINANDDKSSPRENESPSKRRGPKPGIGDLQFMEQLRIARRLKKTIQHPVGDSAFWRRCHRAAGRGGSRASRDAAIGRGHDPAVSFPIAPCQ